MRPVFLLGLAVLSATIFPPTARADTITLWKAGSWETSIENGQFVGVIGRTDFGNPRPAKVRELAFFLSMPSHKFGLLLEDESLALPRGAKLPVVVSFPGQGAFRFDATMAGGQLKVAIDDMDVAAWTHAFTAGTIMTVALPTMGGAQWTYDLSGTTPAVTAMATAIAAAGINGLPHPWSYDGSPSSATASPPMPAPSVPAVDEQALARRQLEIARAEAEKARADAARAQADADRARADAERARAQAERVAEAKVKAAEQARMAAERDAAEQRRNAGETKAESDTHGTLP